MRLQAGAVPLIALLIVMGPRPAAADDFDTCQDDSGDRAIAACSRAISSGRYSGRDLAIVHRHRGMALRGKGEFERAIADHTEAIRIDPRSHLPWNSRCWARATWGRQLEEALKDCTESLQLRPEYHHALNSRGLARLRLGQLDDAIADFSAALKVQSRHAESLYGRGLAKLKKGDEAGSKADMAAAKRIMADVAEEFASWGVK